ncbi:NADAR family protein [Bremerella sp. JC770]|uniref:NADAR family protein n=1 Tax=Bremerella sp. JC770 TaxID=3232137 RepID=UPI00345B3850
MAIEFYSTKSKYGEFSNFAAFGFHIEDYWYPTSEHYFQAMKFEDTDYQQKIRETKSPMIAARLGRSRKVKIREDWEAVKVDVMRTAVRAKIQSHPELQDVLLGTGEAQIIEAAARDYFWGAGKDGSGQNWLGKILMEVRSELQAKITT